jgi:prenylcysteine oxidase/farnesylcysteine lyase
VNAYNSSLTPVELGASIFVEVNTILKNATAQFGLQTRESESEKAETLGIWVSYSLAAGLNLVLLHLN